MPKIAREYDYGYSSDCRESSVYSYKSYADLRYKKTNTRQKAVRRKKKKPLAVLISGLFFLFLSFCVLPFGFNHITKEIFTPTPYQNIKTDMHELAFPTSKYLVNSWNLGNRYFSYSANVKKAKMLPLTENVNMPVLQSQLENLAALYPTVEPSVYVWDYETGNYADIQASKVYSTASIIKIPVLIHVFRAIDAGQFSLDDTMPLTEYYRTEGSGGMQFKAADSNYSIDYLARHMITDSDNSATNMIIAKVGSMDAVNYEIRSWGLKGTGLQTWLPDYKGNNHTTARDMAQMLYNIDENDKFLTEESRSRMLNYMGHVHNNRLIQAGLGAGSVFLHKTGDIGTMLGDAGIVIAPNGKKYIVVILANRPHNSVAGKDFIVHASKIIYNYMVK